MAWHHPASDRPARHAFVCACGRPFSFARCASGSRIAELLKAVRIHLRQRVEYRATVRGRDAVRFCMAEHGIADGTQRHAAGICSAKATSPHAGESACAIAFALQVGVSTTKAGRSLLSLPDRRPATSRGSQSLAPRVRSSQKVQAGSWLIAFVCTVLIKAMSSTCFAVCGSNSSPQRPHCPCCANLNKLGATETAPADVAARQPLTAPHSAAGFSYFLQARLGPKYRAAKVHRSCAGR